MDMTGQPRLYVTAVEDAHMVVHYEGHEGWRLHVKHRRQGDAWDSEPGELYTGLSTTELHDVITAHWANLLGL